MGIATLLDPRFKHFLLEHCFDVLLGTTGENCEYEVAKVKESLSDLMLKYHSEKEDGVGSSTIKAATISN